MDALLEAAILLALCSYHARRNGYARQWAAYIDPIVLIVLAVQMLPSAIHIIVPSIA